MKLVRSLKCETCSRVWAVEHLFDMLPNKNGLEQEGSFSPLLFNFALQCAIRGGLGKLGELEIEWYTSAFRLCC